MKIVSTSYTNTPEFNDPVAWLDRISFYTGILEVLAKHHEVESIEQINFTGKLKRNGVLYHFLNFKKRKLHFPLVLHRFIKKIRPDIVFVNGFIFPLQIIQLKLQLGKTIKIIVLHRGEKPFVGMRGFLQRLADRTVSAYLFSSAEFGKEWVIRGNISDQKKIHEVIQGSSFFYPQESPYIRSTADICIAPVFLWVGRLDANKDPVTIVKAFIKYLSFQPSAKLYMIYQTEELLQEIRDLIRPDSKAMDAIRLIGQIPHQQMQTWYHSADFIISGSHYEGSGIAVCEAMSCGCIPVVTNIMSFRKMTGPGKCGLLYEPGNEKDLLAVLLQTREMDIERERTRVLKQFSNELSFEAIANKINKVIACL